MPSKTDMSTRISVRMVMDALREQCAAYEDAKVKAKLELDRRNALIQEAREAGIGYKYLTRATGLTKESLSLVVNKAKPVTLDDTDPVDERSEYFD